MIKEDVVASWQDVNAAKVKEIKGLFDMGCVSSGVLVTRRMISLMPGGLLFGR